MALNFQSASSDVSNHGSATSIDDFDPFTHLFWMNWRSTSGAQRLQDKGGAVGSGHALRKIGNSGALGILLSRATTNTEYVTSTFPMILNVWRFIACAFDSGASAGEVVNFYSGGLSTTATEDSYTTSTDGSGTVSSDASSSLLIGNDSGGNRSIQADIAIYAYINRALTLGECVSWQFHPRVILGTRMFTIYGFNGTGTQPDWSGNGNAGTLTGTSVAAHVPLGPPFGFDNQDVSTIAVGPPVVGGGVGWVIKRRRRRSAH